MRTWSLVATLIASAMLTAGAASPQPPPQGLRIVVEGEDAVNVFSSRPPSRR